MASLYRLDVIVRGNSTVTQDYAVKWTKNWVNKRQEEDENKDENGKYLKEYYADLYDSRTNKSWKVFSDVATENRAIENEYVCENGEIIKGVIFTSPYLMGESKEVIVDSEDGILHIAADVKNATIFATVEDSLVAEVRIENQTDDGFDIVLYDSTAFVEDRIRLNCKEKPIRVNYLIIRS